MLDWLENLGGWMAEAPRAWLAAALAGIALAALSRRRAGPIALGLLALALVAGVAEWLVREGGSAPVAAKVLAGAFAVAALGSAGAMMASRNPVYSALAFAASVLGCCGLFLAMGAPFLAAATAIVYAGAIIVTFLFVIMLAQTRQLSAYDLHPWNPLPAALGAAAFAGVALTIVNGNFAPVPARGADAAAGIPQALRRVPSAAGTALVLRPADAAAFSAQRSALSEPTPDDRGQLAALGRTLWGDYLMGVELAGTLLLVAAIGAIAINQRPREGRA